MSGIEFFQTGTGRKFYESDIPKIVDSLEKIAEALQKLVKLEEDKACSKELNGE